MRRLGLLGREKEKGRREKEKKKKEKGRDEEENLGLELLFGTFVWNSYLELLYGIYMNENPSFSKLCWKNPIRNVVGWYKMSFMVYFEFWLSWFWFGRKFPYKMAKSGHFCILLDTHTPRRRSAHLCVELHLGEGPYA